MAPNTKRKIVKYWFLLPLTRNICCFSAPVKNHRHVCFAIADARHFSVTSHVVFFSFFLRWQLRPQQQRTAKVITQACAFLLSNPPRTKPKKHPAERIVSRLNITKTNYKQGGSHVAKNTVRRSKLSLNLGKQNADRPAKCVRLKITEWVVRELRNCPATYGFLQGRIFLSLTAETNVWRTARVSTFFFCQGFRNSAGPNVNSVVRWKSSGTNKTQVRDLYNEISASSIN